MSENQKRMLETAASKKMSASGRADGENGRYSSSGLRSGYIAQGAVPRLTYALTMNGYIVL